MQRRSPLASAGLRMFEASSEPPLVAPAPITVWISSMNRIACLLASSSVSTRLEPLLEIAAVARAGQQRAQVERVDHRVLEDLGHLALDDAQRQALGDRGLADAGVADEQRVVLRAPAQDLDRALDLVLAPDQDVDPALARP